MNMRAMGTCWMKMNKEGFSAGADDDPEQNDKVQMRKSPFRIVRKEELWKTGIIPGSIDKVNNETCPPESNLLECHLYISHS